MSPTLQQNVKKHLEVVFKVVKFSQVIHDKKNPELVMARNVFDGSSTNTLGLEPIEGNSNGLFAKHKLKIDNI